MLARPGFIRRVAGKPLGVASAVFLVVVIFACVLAPVISPYGALQQDLLHINGGPSAAHWLGTDELGRDILSRLLYGGRVTLLGVAECVGVILGISIPIGLMAGYMGGVVDRWVNNVVDLLLSVPNIIIVLAVLAVFGTSMAAGMVTFGLLGSAGVVRVLRSTVLSVREELYVDAARLSGLSDLRIMTRHILPRVAGPIIVQGSLWCGIALGVQTGLAFLGVGITPPAPSWGGMVGEASQLIYQDPWMLVPSGGIIALTILAFALLGDAVRDAAFEGWSAASAEAPVGRRKQRRSAFGVNDIGHGEVAVPGRSEAILSVRHLSVAFETPRGPLVVVDDVNFELCAGEVLGIVGESGSGKSVTALAIMGLLPGNGRISQGRVILGEKELSVLSERAINDIRGDEIAIVFQEPMSALDPAFTVGAQVAEVVRQHERVPRKVARARVVELFQQVRLPDPVAVAKRYAHELSGGMAQRVCLALALAGKPRVLIADEPTTALDVTVQAEILSLLRTLQQETGMSVLLVTHDWGVVADLCDRALVMYAGQIVEEAAVKDMFARPSHPYTRGLQMCNPAVVGDTDELPSIEGTIPPPHRWPAGCRFFERCNFATAECATAAVSMEPDGEGRQVRCLHWGHVAGLATREGAR